MGVSLSYGFCLVEEDFDALMSDLFYAALLHYTRQFRKSHPSYITLALGYDVFWFNSALSCSRALSSVRGLHFRVLCAKEVSSEESAGRWATQEKWEETAFSIRLLSKQKQSAIFRANSKRLTLVAPQV